MAERVDDLQYKGLRLIQDTDGFCFGVDAVLLAHMAKNTPSQNTIDLCSGNGIVALLLAGKTDTPHITALATAQRGGFGAAERGAQRVRRTRRGCMRRRKGGPKTVYARQLRRCDM